MENTTKKPIWHNVQKVKCLAVKLIRDSTKKELLKAVKLELEDKDVLYYAKNTKIEIDSVSGIETERKVVEPYLITEFISNNPMLLELSKNTKKEYQEIVITFAESEFMDNMYYKMFKGQFETIYYPKYHGKDTSNLDKQKMTKTKHEVDLEMPMD